LHHTAHAVAPPNGAGLRKSRFSRFLFVEFFHLIFLFDGDSRLLRIGFFALMVFFDICIVLGKSREMRFQVISSLAEGRAVGAVEVVRR
jgi:hypothetical protein